MVLRVPLDFSPVVIYKGSGVPQAPAKKRLKFVLRDRDKAVCIFLSLVLLPVKTDPVPEERHGKKNLIGPFSSNGGKLVLILLIEVIALHMGLSAIYI